MSMRILKSRSLPTLGSDPRPASTAHRLGTSDLTHSYLDGRTMKFYRSENASTDDALVRLSGKSSNFSGKTRARGLRSRRQ